MGAIEIAEVLKNNYPQFISYRDIVEQTNKSKRSVQRCLARMRRRNDVEFKIIQGKNLNTTWTILYRIRIGEDNNE